MLKEKIEKALNEQINRELYSSYLYLSMCAYAQKLGLPGVANWMKVQAKEELTHANKFFDYIIERNGKVELKAIDAVPVEFGNIIETFQKVLEHEEYISESINKLVDAGIVEGYNNGHYGGDRLITRYEMAQIVAKAMAKGAGP